MKIVSNYIAGRKLGYTASQALISDFAAQKPQQSKNLIQMDLKIRGL